MRYLSKNNKLEDRLRHLEEENGFLRDVNRKIRLLLDATEESAILGDQDGQVLASNERAAQRLGKTVDGLVGLNMYDYLPQELADSRKQYGDEALRSGKTVRFQDQRAGHVYDNHITPVFNEEGHFEAFAVYARDITLILQFEKDLQESETKFKSITEQSPNMIFINVDGNIVYANSRCTEVMGHTQEEFYGDDFDFRCLIASDSTKRAENQHKKTESCRTRPP